MNPRTEFESSTDASPVSTNNRSSNNAPSTKPATEELNFVKLGFTLQINRTADDRVAARVQQISSTPTVDASSNNAWASTDLSHSMQNRLNGICLALQVLKAKWSVRGQGDEYLLTILKRELNQLETLVSNRPEVAELWHSALLAAINRVA